MNMQALLFTALAWAALVAPSANARGISVWERLPENARRELGGDDEGDAAGVLVQVDHRNLIDALTKGNNKAKSGGSERDQPEEVSLHFDLPEVGSINCIMGPSNVFHPDLAAKFPDIILKSGVCSDSSVVTLNAIAGTENSLGATFTLPYSNDFVYVDKHGKDNGVYKITHSKHKKKPREKPFECKSLVPPEHLKNKRNLAEAEFEVASAGRDLQTCGNEVAITMGSSEFTKDFASDNANTDTSGVAYSCGSVGAAAPVRNFRFTAPRNGAFKFDTCKTGAFSSVIRVRKTTCSGTLLVSCSNSSPCASASVDLIEGDVVYVQVAASSGAALPASWTLTASVVKIVGRQVRFAVGVNRELSTQWGSTQVNVLNKIAIIVTRLSGIYMRELGIYFQVIARTNLLLCTSNVASCALANTNAGTVLDQVQAFIQGTGVQTSEFDLAHIFGTFNGGVAWLGQLCGTWKWGVSGTQYTDDNSFVTDVLAHEVGHNFGADHSMRDCTPTTSYGVNSGQAVEPGSGSTIMSYASGACPSDRNLIWDKDPYFHAANLPVMRAEVLSVPTCGTILTATPDQATPTILSPAVGATCSLPLNQLFSLRGSADCGPDCEYQWDETNSYLQTYTDTTLPRFRSWRPTTNPMRYFRNLVFLSSTVGTRQTAYEEILPSVSDVTLGFRFIAKTKYLTMSQAATADTSIIGAFSYRDISVNFAAAQGVPLKFTSATVTDLKNNAPEAGTTRSISWDSAGTASWSSQVEILFAPNTLLTVNKGSFNYEDYPVDLVWVSAGWYPNTGSANVLIPSGVGPLSSTTAAVMIRTQEQSSACRAFDFISAVPFINLPTFKPSFAPSTPRPSQTPTTTKPSKAPSTPRPSRAPSGTPSRAPTTTKPSKAPSTPRPSRNPSRAPTKSPTTSRPTAGPVITKSPSKAPTRRPTPIPENVHVLCSISPRMSPTDCAAKRATCSQYGLQMKYGGASCKVGKRRVAETGCYCAAHCAFRCVSSCRADPTCYWVGNAKRGSCFSRATQQRGVAISRC